jgi:16S rRNA (guanine527-N7)-methyltransferase
MYSDMNFDEILAGGSAEFGVQLDTGRQEAFKKYMELLKEWNQKMNLTAIEEDNEVALKHFVDSISILPFIPKGSIRLADIGTGAGFPGIPVKIIRDDADVMLVDSLDKRITFLKEVISTLRLKGINTVHARAEEFGSKAENREAFDVAVARAVAGLPVLLEYCLPLVKAGGLFIAMKGSNIEEELKQSQKALEVLGGKLEAVKEMCLPFSDNKRNIILVRKFRQTPTKYPRKPGKPSKEPLI